MFRRSISCAVIIVFVFSLIGPYKPAQAAQASLALPAPSVLINLSPAFKPAIIKGLKIDPANPLHLDFIIDTGDARLPGQSLREETKKLVKYFLAALTVPEQELWVNLSPYEKNRIIPNGLAQTEMGRDLLAQDYILKQLTATLMYPEERTGKEFWSRIYKEAQEQFGTTDIPVNTFNKVWIVPAQADVYEHDGRSGKVFALLGKSHLKVMLEQDYLSLAKHERINSVIPAKAGIQDTSTLGSQIVRQVILPQIEKEVNEGANFNKVRQISDALILATWFKRSLKESLLGQKYSNKNKVSGIELQEKNFKEQIYDQYLKAFKKGLYNYVKEDVDPQTQKTVVRKYFSGGYDGQVNVNVIKDAAQFSTQYDNAQLGNKFLASVDFAAIAPSATVGSLATAKRLDEIQQSNYAGFPPVSEKIVPTSIQYAIAYYDESIPNSNGNNPVRAMIKEGRLRAGPDNQQIIHAESIENNAAPENPTILVSTDPENEADFELIKLISGDQEAEKFKQWKKDNRKGLNTLINHCSGVIAKPVEVLKRYGIFDLFQGGSRTITMEDIVNHVKSNGPIKFNTPNRQYIHGVLRVLNSLGWLTRKGASASDAMEFTLTPKGEQAITLVDRYAKVADFMPEFSRISDYLFNRPNAPSIKPGAETLKQLVQLAKDNWKIPAEVDPTTAEEIKANLNGYLVGNLALSLYLEGVLDLFDSHLVINLQDIIKAKKIEGNTDELTAAFDIFVEVGFLESLGNGQYKKTVKGLVAFDRVLAYGVPFSYRPSYDLAEQFLFGNVKSIKRNDENGKELLVYRYLNVLGSGASHTTYFKSVDQIVINMMAERKIPTPDELSSQKPFVLAFADTGSGDGKFLAHIHHVIVHETGYGQLMREYPELYKLEMVGVDYNLEAQHATSETLHSQGIEHIVMFGNINDPKQIVKDVNQGLDKEFERQGIGHIHKMVIHTRTFLDHNRPWKKNVLDIEAIRKKGSTSKGAYGWQGVAIPNNVVEQNLYEHFKGWADALASVGQKDLINIELHTIDPDTAADNIGKTLDPSYSLSHLFSDQFIIELPIYLNAITKAGFNIDGSTINNKYFPTGKPEGSTVSINYFTLGTVDKASLAKSKTSDPLGGIDLNPALGVINIERDTHGRVFPMASQPIFKIELNGLQPILLKMVPIHDQKLIED